MEVPSGGRNAAQGTAKGVFVTLDYILTDRSFREHKGCISCLKSGANNLEYARIYNFFLFLLPQCYNISAKHL